MWLQHKDREATRKLVDREMQHVLDAKGSGTAAYESDGETEVD